MSQDAAGALKGSALRCTRATASLPHSKRLKLDFLQTGVDLRGGTLHCQPATHSIRLLAL